MSSESLDSRLEFANQLVEVVDVEKNILERSRHQERLMSLLNSSPLQRGETNIQDVEVQIEDIATFTKLNQKKIEGLQDKKGVILEFLSAYCDIDLSVNEVFYLFAIVLRLLEDSQKLLAEVQQLPGIKLKREARLEMAKLEMRVGILIRNSHVIPKIVSPRGPGWTVEAMESFCIALKHLQERARQLRAHSVSAGSVCNVEDPSLTFRLARVRSGLVHLQETHSGCARDIVIIEEEISESLSSLLLPPKATFQEVSESIETKLNTIVVDFFKADKKTLLQRLSLNACIDIRAIVSRIGLKLEKMIHVEGYLPNFDLDNDNRDILSHIWGCLDVRAMTLATSSTTRTVAHNYIDGANDDNNLIL